MRRLFSCILKPFTEVLSQILKYNLKQAIPLHLISIGIPSCLIFSVKNGGGEGHLMYEITFCLQSLIFFNISEELFVIEKNDFINLTRFHLVNSITLAHVLLKFFGYYRP